MNENRCLRRKLVCSFYKMMPGNVNSYETHKSTLMGHKLTIKTVKSSQNVIKRLWVNIETSCFLSAYPVASIWFPWFMNKSDVMIVFGSTKIHFFFYTGMV